MLRVKTEAAEPCSRNRRELMRTLGHDQMGARMIVENGEFGKERMGE